MRACVFNKTTENGWVYQLGIWAGKYTVESSSNVTTRLALYDTDSSKDPDDRQGYSDSFSVTATMIDNGGGASYVADIAASVGPVSDSIPIYSGRRYSIAALGTVGWLAHAMQEAALISADNERFYLRTGLSQPPPSNFGSPSESTEGHMTIWAVYEANVAPSTPTSLSPSGSINDTAPTFSADFADANSDHGDYLNQFRIQVRRVSDLTSFWDTTLTATSGEQAAEAFSRAYGGTTLVRGTAYEWRTQMSDYFGSWSSWTAWTAFTPANLGFVTLGDDPTGKIETINPDFDGTWTHQSAEDMTRVQVRLLNGTGTTVLQTGTDYDITDVADTDPFTVSWANTGFTDLAWGTAYRFQIRGKDESALWSDWSASQTFSTNAAPTVPSDLSPSNGQIVTDYPLLSCAATDADDTTGTGFEVYARIKNSGGTVLFTRTMTYNATTLRWEYQTDGTDLATFATYRWDAYSYDGTLYSGEASSSGAAVKSSEVSFVFAEGPTVTITSPASGATITTASLPVTWTTVDQAKYRVYLYDETGTELVYDSLEQTPFPVVSAHTIPSGYYHNGFTYQLVVWVEDLTPLEGTSTPQLFTVDYVEPDAITNFQAVAVSIGNDPNGWTTAIRLTWDPTEYGTDVWQRYEIQRQAATGIDSQLILWRNDLSSPSQITVTDYTPVTGIEYTYTIRQIILTGLDELESAAVTAVATATFGGVVLCDVSAPDVLRSALRYTAERPHKFDKDSTKYQPLSGATATTVRSRYRNWETDFKFKLVDDEWSTALDDRNELLALDANMGTICYRNNLGDKYFSTMPRCEPTDQVPEWFEGRIQLEQELYREGATSSGGTAVG